MPASAICSALSESLISRAGAESRAKNSFGWGSSRPRPSAAATARPRSRKTARIAWCPRWTPSKLPIATARPGSASRQGSKPRRICMALPDREMPRNYRCFRSRGRAPARSQHAEIDDRAAHDRDPEPEGPARRVPLGPGRPVAGNPPQESSHGDACEPDLRKQPLPGRGRLEDAFAAESPIQQRRVDERREAGRHREQDMRHRKSVSGRQAPRRRH